MYRVEFDQIVAQEISGTADELIETLQGRLEVATGKCKRIATLKSYCGKLMDSTIIAAYL